MCESVLLLLFLFSIYVYIYTQEARGNVLCCCVLREREINTNERLSY